MNNILFSKKSDNWRTPKIIYDAYINNNYFDPCPYESNFDGLSIEWKEKNFVNPPYSQISKWVNKSIEEHKKGKENDEGIWQEIVFNIEDKIIDVYKCNGIKRTTEKIVPYRSSISINLLQAINKQVEELGWK